MVEDPVEDSSVHEDLVEDPVEEVEKSNPLMIISAGPLRGNEMFVRSIFKLLIYFNR